MTALGSSISWLPSSNRDVVVEEMKIVEKLVRRLAERKEVAKMAGFMIVTQLREAYFFTIF